MLAAWNWRRVWRLHTISRISLALSYTGVCCLIKVVRSAVMIVSRSP